MRVLGSLFWLLPIIGSVTLPSVLVWAQEAQAIPALSLNPAQPPAATDSQVPIQLETIVVTAQKREERGQDVPMALTGIKGKTLRESGTFDASGLEERSPNIQISLDAQDPIVSIRGFTSDPDNVGFEPAVGLVLDDLALGRAEFVQDGFFDLDRIEVLRGPQGTLFGKNTIAGVVGFKTVEPGVDGHGRLQTTFDALGNQHAELGQDVPFGDHSGLRLASAFGYHEGDLYNSTLQRKENEFTQMAARLKMFTSPSDALTIRLSGQISQTRGSYGPIQLFDVPDSVLEFGRKYDSAFEDNPLDRHTSEDFPGFVDRDSIASRLLVNYDFGAALGARKLATTLIAGYASINLDALIDADVSPAAVALTDYGLEYRQHSVEWRLTGDSGSLFGWGHDINYVLGALAFRSGIVSRLDQIAGDDLVAFGTSPAGLATLGAPDLSVLLPLFAALPTTPGVPLDDKLFRHFGQQSRSLAVFGQTNWNFYRAWSAILGLRLNRERKSATFDVSTEGPGIIGTIVGAKPFKTARARGESDVSPKLGLSYQWSEDLLMYVTATRGFEGGGYNANANTSADLGFEPERATSIESGLKASWFGGSLRGNLALYDTQVGNLQVVYLQGGALRVGNAAKVLLRGLEAELSWQPRIRWLRLDGALGISKAKYLSYRNAPPTAQQRDDKQDSQDLSGRTLPNAPKISVILSPSVRWPLPFGTGLVVELAANAVYRGDQYSATNLDPHTLQRGYWVLGSSLYLGRKDRHYGFIISGKNLAGQKALSFARDNAVYKHSYEDQQIGPRTLQLSLIANW